MSGRGAGGRPPEAATTAALLRALCETGDLERAVARVPGLDDVEGARRALAALADDLAGPVRKAAPRTPRTGGAVHRVRVCSDGAARGNPGPAGAGAVIQDESGEVLLRLGRYLGETTNNVAEYEGLLLGLRHALELGAREVQVVADSELLVKQLKGQYRVKAPHLKPLFQEARSLLSRFEAREVMHVLRAENKAADEMANRAIDERLAD